MKLFEVANTQLIIKELTPAIVSWTQNEFIATAQHRQIIKKYTPMFKYTGPMVRMMSLFDLPRTELTPAKLKQRILAHERGTDLASWCPNKEYIDEFVDLSNEDGDSDIDPGYEHVIYVEQHGTGFDIYGFYTWLRANLANYDKNISKPADFMIERAASIREIISPYLPNMTCECTVTNRVTDDYQVEYDIKY